MVVTGAKNIFSKLHPLSLISEHYYDSLSEGCEIKTLKPHEIVIRKPFDRKITHYLLDGCVEVRKSFEDRCLLSSIDKNACYPLEEQINTGGTGGVIKTKETCRVIVVNVDVVDRFLTSCQSDDYKIVHLDSGDSIMQDGFMIEDGVEEDWTEQFFQSQLASHLPSSVLHDLFNKLEDINVVEGKVIIEKNTPGDFFYIIKEGVVCILTDSDGPYGGKSIELTSGDFFGDEALVADTIRNATVVMASDGLLGRLESESFNQIIRKNLVIPFDYELQESVDNYHYIDVRHPIEYKHSHLENSVNIPISHLRKKLDEFNSNKTYVITADGGRRSELAVYLLRQAGINSYYMLPDSV